MLTGGRTNGRKFDRAMPEAGETKTVSNVTEQLVEHGIHSLPCSYTNGVIDLPSQQLPSN